MFHLLQFLASKTVGAIAGIIIAVGIVKMPQEIVLPVVAQYRDAASTSQSVFSSTTISVSISTTSVVTKKKNNISDSAVVETKQALVDSGRVIYDACKNLEGIQDTVPTGWNVKDGVCSIPQPTADALAASAIQKAQREDQARQYALQAAQQASVLQAQQEAAILQAQIAQKQALLAQMKAECDDPINALTQQILDIKTKYFADLSNLQKKSIDMQSMEGEETRLLNDANTKIQDLANQINQIKLSCSIKFGN